jgi:hypothetical protein
MINDFLQQLDNELKSIRDMLASKNTAYGNAALSPMNVFSNLNSSESILVRIDDKLSRIKNRGINCDTEDTVKDLIGYLILLRISKDMTNEQAKSPRTFTVDGNNVSFTAAKIKSALYDISNCGGEDKESIQEDNGTCSPASRG